MIAEALNSALMTSLIRLQLIVTAFLIRLDILSAMRRFVADQKRLLRNRRIDRMLRRRQARRILYDNEVLSNRSIDCSSSDSDGGWGSPVWIANYGSDRDSMGSSESRTRDPVFDLNRWVSFVRRNWDRWVTEVDTRCMKALRYMSAFPNPRNMDALMGLENVRTQMKQVRVSTVW